MPDPTQHTVAAMLADEVTDLDLDRVADMPLNAERAAALRALGDRAAALEARAADHGLLGEDIDVREIGRLRLPISVTAFVAITQIIDDEFPGSVVGMSHTGWAVFRRPAPETALPLSEHDGG